jgi:hypothetical protein
MENKVLNKIITLFIISIFFISCTEYEDGYKNGYKDGNHKGYEEGKLDGYEHGKLDGHQNGWNERQNQGFFCHECNDVRFEYR